MTILSTFLESSLNFLSYDLKNTTKFGTVLLLKLISIIFRRIVSNKFTEKENEFKTRVLINSLDFVKLNGSEFRQT